MRVLLVLLALSLTTNCSDPDICGSDGTLIERGEVRYCFYRDAVVIEGGFDCPAATPFRVDGPAGTVCSDSEISDASDLPEDLCRDIGLTCGPGDAGADVGPPDIGLDAPPADLTWTRRDVVTSPPERQTFAAAFHPPSEQFVVTGGFGVGSTELDDVWAWDGSSWNDLNPSPRPNNRNTHAMTFLPGSGLVLFGGFREGGEYLADTWVFDGAAWTELSPATPPSARQGYALATDTARNVVVLFSGSGAPGSFESDTWEFTGTEWNSVVTPTTPPGRQATAMAFDSDRGVSVLFSGQDSSGYLPDTWEWNGTQWQEVTPATSPPAREGHAMAFMSGLGVVLYGGIGDELYDDVWTFDGSAWTQLVTDNPPARRNHQMAYDSVRDELVIFGGRDTPGGEAVGETWVLRR